MYFIQIVLNLRRYIHYIVPQYSLQTRIRSGISLAFSRWNQQEVAMCKIVVAQTALVQL